MEGAESVRARAAGFVKGQIVLVVSAVLAVASMLLVPPSLGYVDYIDVRMLCILFCFMAVVAGMRECHLFGALAGKFAASASSGMAATLREAGVDMDLYRANRDAIIQAALADVKAMMLRHGEMMVEFKGEAAAMLCGGGLVIAIRILSAHCVGHPSALQHA